MAVTAAQLKAKYSEFASTDDAVVTAALDEAGRQMSAAFYGNVYDDALIAMGAHILETDALIEAGGSTPPGLVTSESLDGWSASYASNSRDQSAYSAWLASTKYGRKVRALRAMGVRVMRMS